MREKRHLSSTWPGKVARPNCTNLTQLIFGLQAYLNVHSSENGQTATHSTRQNGKPCGKQLVTKPAEKLQK